MFSLPFCTPAADRSIVAHLPSSSCTTGRLSRCVAGAWYMPAARDPSVCPAAAHSVSALISSLKVMTLQSQKRCAKSHSARASGLRSREASLSTRAPRKRPRGVPRASLDRWRDQLMHFHARHSQRGAERSNRRRDLTRWLLSTSPAAPRTGCARRCRWSLHVKSQPQRQQRSLQAARLVARDPASCPRLCYPAKTSVQPFHGAET